MNDYLERFQNRMEFAAVIDSIVNRRNKNTELEAGFAPYEIDNLLFSVLVFIMECTLTEDRDCTLREISRFLKEILPCYHKELSLGDIEVLTRYLVKDILRNNGKKRSYGCMNYEQGEMTENPVMLIEDYLIGDRVVAYKLTAQGYNFLFRTKEIDDELGFKMEEFRLKMLIAKKNYKKAVSQSQELIQILRNKENQLKLFEKRLRNNMKQVSSAEYTDMIHDIYALLEQEYDIMQEIHSMISLAKECLHEEEANHGRLDEKVQNAKKEVTVIERNVETALDFQRRLIIQCKKTKDIYVEMLQDAIRYMHKKTFDFEKTILCPLEGGGVHDTTLLDKLLQPLMKPQFQKRLNVAALYAYQAINEADIETAVQEEPEFEETGERTARALRNRNYVCLMEAFFLFSASHAPTFCLSDFLAHLDAQESTRALAYDKHTYLAFLKLYEFGELRLAVWRDSSDVISTEPTGEFDLSYCLYQISVGSQDFYRIDTVTVSRTDEMISCTGEFGADTALKTTAHMHNLVFEVRLLEESTSALQKASV